MSRKRKQPRRKLVTFKTPGRECAHADKGCCPKCQHQMSRFERFESRKPLQ